MVGGVRYGKTTQSCFSAFLQRSIERLKHLKKCTSCQKMKNKKLFFFQANIFSHKWIKEFTLFFSIESLYSSCRDSVKSESHWVDAFKLFVLFLVESVFFTTLYLNEFIHVASCGFEDQTLHKVPHLPVPTCSMIEEPEHVPIQRSSKPWNKNLFSLRFLYVFLPRSRLLSRRFFFCASDATSSAARRRKSVPASQNRETFVRLLQSHA